jgi:uncharacterized surface protein with fasciclin (FAS1) repeats
MRPGALTSSSSPRLGNLLDRHITSHRSTPPTSMKPIHLTLLSLIPLVLAYTQPQQQQPLMASMADKPPGSPLLGDILPLDKQISIFSGFTRSVESISELLMNRESNTTVLAPSNVAISRLPRKPWEDPRGDAEGVDAYAGIAGEDRANRNLRRFVEAHCVGLSPWEEGTRVKTVEGTEVWWENRDGGKRVMPGDIKVLQVKEGCENGQVWVLDGVVSSPPPVASPWVLTGWDR